MRCLCPLIAVFAVVFGSQFAQGGKKDCCAPTSCAPQPTCCQFPLSYIDALKRAEDAGKAEAQVAELNQELAELKAQRDAAIAQAKAAKRQADESANAARAARDEADKANAARKAAEEERAKAEEDAAVALKNQQQAEAAAKEALQAAEVAKVAETEAKADAFQKGKQLLELQAQLDDAKGKQDDETPNSPQKAQQPAKLEDQPKVEEELKSE